MVFLVSHSDSYIYSVDWRLTSWASTRCTTLSGPHLMMIFTIAGAQTIECAWFKVQVYSWFIQILTWLCDDSLPDIKTRVVTDRRTDGQTKIAQVIAVTLSLHFVARVNYITMAKITGRMWYRADRDSVHVHVYITWGAYIMGWPGYEATYIIHTCKAAYIRRGKLHEFTVYHHHLHEFLDFLKNFQISYSIQ